MEMKRKAHLAVLAEMEKEREGESIDRSLLKNVLSIFIEVGMGGMDAYEQDFEAPMLKATAAYYSRKAAVSYAGSIDTSHVVLACMFMTNSLRPRAQGSSLLTQTSGEFCHVR